MGDSLSHLDDLLHGDIKILVRDVDRQTMPSMARKESKAFVLTTLKEDRSSRSGAYGIRQT